ncbi:hypothetical protein Hanom_Chr17g01544471 [Helianthus anomalus]
MGQNGFGSKWVRVKTGRLKKGLYWFGSKRVRVKPGSGRNGLGSERVSGQNGFRVGLVKKMFFLKRLYIKGQFCRVKTGPGWFGLKMDSGREGYASKKCMSC